MEIYVVASSAHHGLVKTELVASHGVNFMSEVMTDLARVTLVSLDANDAFQAVIVAHATPFDPSNVNTNNVVPVSV